MWERGLFQGLEKPTGGEKHIIKPAAECICCSDAGFCDYMLFCRPACQDGGGMVPVRHSRALVLFGFEFGKALLEFIDAAQQLAHLL